MRYRKEIDNVRAHINTLRGAIALLAVLLLLVWYGWHQAPAHLRVHIPPDIRSGAVMKADEVPPADVYAFAHYIFQQLNHWPENGDEDYGAAIYRLSPYLTPRYRAELEADLELRGRRGELAYRRRGVQELPGHGYEERRVEILDAETWVVWLDLSISEWVKGMTVKQTAVRYPLRVVRYDVDPELNPWGLALDGFTEEGPRRLSESEQESERPETGS
ncbi:MAG: TIGR03746 family integrating conjugative element protein [Gammaproteobacteria bacterium]|nr:TIGR03746 family integrating conjugative element protein [Gammaproteobacteria bacterium]